MKTYAELTSLCLSAVAQASEILGSSSEGFSIENKTSSRDLVTDLEFTIERYLTEALAKSDIQVIGEELSATAKVSSEANWWIDPIDGTSNFVVGLPYYAISAGLVKAKDFHIGAVAVPSLKEIYFTYNENTAFCNGKKLKVQNTTIENSIVGASFSKKSNISETEQYKIFGDVNDRCRSVMRTGSAAFNVCNVANAKFGAAYGFEAKVWDVAGALAVARAAGCKIMARFTSDTTLDYIVGNAGCFDQIVQLTGIK